MVGVAEKNLSKELFSEEERLALRELLEKTARAKLHPPILKFIQQVEGVLEKIQPKIVPVVQTTATQPTSIVSPELAKPVGKQAVASSDRKPTLRSVLSVYLRQHPGEELTTRGVVDHIHQKSPRFTALYIRAEVSRIKREKSSIEGGKVVGERGKLKFVPETSPQGAGNVNVTGKPAVAQTITPSARPSVRIGEPTGYVPGRETTLPTRRTETTHGVMQRPAPQLSAPREPQPTAEVYMTQLSDAIKGLGKKEQDAVRSYVSRISGIVPGQTDNVQLNPVQLLNLSVFTESFVRIQRFKDLPAELYGVLEGFNFYDQQKVREFQDELHAAKDSFDVLSAVSKHTRSPYAPCVNEMRDIYTEDAELAKHLKEAEGFHTETVIARNKIPRLRVRQFYETIKKIGHDINWGGRYSDVLRLVRNDPRKAVNFFVWASAQQNINGYQFDNELRTYMPLGGRARPMAKEDLDYAQPREANARRR